MNSVDNTRRTFVKRFAGFALTSMLVFAGCRAPAGAIPRATSQPSIDSLGEMTAAPTALAPPSLQPDAFDYRALIGNPPADDSKEHREELELMLKLQAQRTPADEKRCQDEVAVTVFGFANELGPWFNPKDCPYTAQIMKEAGQQAKAVSGGGKKIWSRVRPPMSDSRLHPCVPLEKTFSYPSGHSTIGAFWGTLLADMFPVDRDILLARGQQIGFDRTVAGMHWPSDIVAGQKVGAEAARRLLADAGFREKLQKAKAECLEAMMRSTTNSTVTGGATLPSMRTGAVPTPATSSPGR